MVLVWSELGGFYDGFVFFGDVDGSGFCNESGIFCGSVMGRDGVGFVEGGMEKREVVFGGFWV